MRTISLKLFLKVVNSLIAHKGDHNVHLYIYINVARELVDYIRSSFPGLLLFVNTFKALTGAHHDLVLIENWKIKRDLPVS